MRRVCALIIVACAFMSAQPEASRALVAIVPAAAKARVVKHIDTDDPVFFITIDDGTRVSPALAKLLDKRKIPVTSFVLPEYLSAAQKKSRAWFLARKRMTFENHTNIHAHLTLMTLAQQKREICTASALVKKRTGQTPVFLRPPRGKWDENTRIAAAACGMKYIVTWNAESSKDGLNTWGTRPLMKGDIVLFHYVGSLVQQLENVLAIAKQNGLRPALLRDYLK